jgi:hypothetical protein
MDDTRGPWINTVSGRRFHPLDPRPDEIDAEDIGWSLSMVCRFNGGLRQFFSVAQHCVMVANHVPPEHAFAGLLHDASEAYLGDVVTPLKAILDGRYKSLENSVGKAIFERFGLSWPMCPEIKVADQRAVATEIRDLTPASVYWKPGTEPYPGKIRAWSQEEAFLTWMNWFKYHQVAK